MRRFKSQGPRLVFLGDSEEKAASFSGDWKYALVYFDVVLVLMVVDRKRSVSGCLSV